MNNALATTEVTTDQQDTLLVSPTQPTQAVIIHLEPDYTAIKPVVGDVRFQDKDDINNSDFIQFKVDDGLGRVEISSPNLFKFLHDLIIKPNAPLDKAILIRNSLDTQDNININEDGSIDVRVGAFPLVTLQADLGSPLFTFLNGYIQNLFITALTATGISCDTLTVGGGYGSSGVSIDGSGNVQMNGKLTVDGAIDPTELDMPDDAPVYYDTAKSKSTKFDSATSKVKVTGVREFAEAVEILDSLGLADDKFLYFDTAKSKKVRYKKSQSQYEFDDKVKVSGDLVVGNTGKLDWSTNECLPKIFSQGAEPNIDNDTSAFWWNTALNQMWLIIDRGGTQYKVQLA